MDTAERIQRLQRHHCRWRYSLGQDLCHELFVRTVGHDLLQRPAVCHVRQDHCQLPAQCAGNAQAAAFSRGYNVKERRAENCMTISKGGRTNEFYFFGGKDESSQDLIQGITLAGAFFDEVA